MSKEIEDAIIEAVRIVTQEGGHPDNIWHPNYGWVLLNGEPTETSEAFYHEIILGLKE